MLSENFVNKTKKIRDAIVRDLYSLKRSREIIRPGERRFFNEALTTRRNLDNEISKYEAKLERFDKLYNRFAQIMSYEDSQLRTLNSNERVDFMSDPVYKNAKKGFIVIDGSTMILGSKFEGVEHPMRGEIRKRVVREEEYAGALVNLKCLGIVERHALPYYTRIQSYYPDSI